MARNATNTNLHQAKQSKKDEFYTQYCDIESELQHYEGCFKGKVIYCNCDNPSLSNFFKYFVDHFKELELKKVMCSCYASNDTLFTHDNNKALFGEYEGKDIIIRELVEDGDFRSNECIGFLNEADVVVTNPPFSLYREFVSQLARYDKKFLVLCNVNSITYKEIFELIQNNRAWLGVNLGRGISGFIVPEHYDLYGTEVHINDKGERIVSTNDCTWLTNLDIEQRHDFLQLEKSYIGHEDSYPKYDNCDAINVGRTNDIPCDYYGLMGVPITFLHKYNPEQFEIVKFRKGDNDKDLCINGKAPYFRILIRRRQ